MINSTPFILSDQSNEEDPFHGSLSFTPIDQLTDDESALNSFAVGSIIESPFEGDPTMWQDYSDPELDVSLQPSDTYATDIVATSPSKISFQYNNNALN